MSEHWWSLRDEIGFLRLGWTIAAVGAAVVVAIGGFLAACLAVSWKVETRNCSEKAQRLHFAESSYDLWASTCFVTLPDGRSVDLASIRFNEQGQVSR